VRTRTVEMMKMTTNARIFGNSDNGCEILANDTNGRSNNGFHVGQ
jgi:hypothetical protein